MAKSHDVQEIRDIITCAICLELYENACMLPCSHTYCLACLYALCEESSSPTAQTRCPQCRQLTIPRLSALNQLPLHQFANQLADLVRQQDGAYTPIAEEPCDGEASSELFEGDYLPPPADLTDKRSKGVKIASNIFKGVASVATLGLGALYFSAQAAKKKREKQSLLANDPLECFTCANCQTRYFYMDNPLRYKCGMCEDFNLCQGCASGNMARVHRPDHILVKIKFRQKRRLPPGCILKYRKTREMSEEIDYSTTRHSRAYYHTAERIQWVEGISCDFCAESPIVGTRYKCGMCKNYDLCERCEKHSTEIHDKDHVFLIFRNRAKVNVISEPLMKALIY